MRVIKDNSIGLLEFVFDLNFDEILKKKKKFFLMRSTVNVEVWKYIIIFPKNPNKIVQNKDKDFLEFNSITESLKSYHHVINYLNK